MPARDAVGGPGQPTPVGAGDDPDAPALTGSTDDPEVGGARVHHAGRHRGPHGVNGTLRLHTDGRPPRRASHATRPARRQPPQPWACTWRFGARIWHGRATPWPARRPTEAKFRRTADKLHRLIPAGDATRL